MGKALGAASYGFRELDAHGDMVRNWRHRSLKMTANVVCGKCNNGWMSDLEHNEAKPTMKDMIVYGNPVSLLPRGLASIAAFAFTKAVIADCMRPHGLPFFPSSVRRRFRTSLQIPYGVQMWLAAGTGWSGRIKSYYLPIKSGPLNGFELYVFTYIAGYLALQLVASRWTKNPRRPIRFPVFWQQAVWESVAKQFWPNSNSTLTWPPIQQLRGQSINAFCDRWKTLNIGAD